MQTTISDCGDICQQKSGNDGYISSTDIIVVSIVGSNHCQFKDGKSIWTELCDPADPETRPRET